MKLISVMSWVTSCVVIADGCR